MRSLVLALALATPVRGWQAAWQPSGVLHPRARPCFSCAADDLQEKQLQAERLQRLAAEAEAEAQELERMAQALQPVAKAKSDEEAATPPPARAPAAEDDPMVLTAPLRWLGPYPAVALSFPGLSTPAQKARQLAGETAVGGVTLDFVLDTAANTNTVSAQVAAPTAQGGLDLTAVGRLSGGVGAGGQLGGGTTYMLGSAELADAPADERVPFISGLTASALPVAAPAAAGLLGSPFLLSFAGGVEFTWGRPPRGAGAEVGAAGDATPLVALYGDEVGVDALRRGLTRVPITPLASSGLPSVVLTVNGVEVLALLDTGSPITVLNAAAASAAGLAFAAADPAAANTNPFARLAAGLQTARAAAQGEVLTIGSADGPVTLARASAASISLGECVELGDDIRPYVGDLPGLAALDGLGAGSGAAAVLGIDVLCRRPRMWYTREAVYL